jgi:hypothetical protein
MTEWHYRYDDRGRRQGKQWTDAGDRLYYLHGVLHRTGGPAVVRADGSREYWVLGRLMRRVGADGSVEVVRTVMPRARGGDRWRAVHYSVEEDVFLANWGGRIAARLTLREAERMDRYSLGQLYLRLPHARIEAQAGALFGAVRGAAWLRGATVQEKIILCLDGDPRCLATMG